MLTIIFVYENLPYSPLPRCHCACREREEHCDVERHFYDSSECRCRCRNPSERTECIAAGKEWDDRTCSCACPRSTWRQCSTGYTFDYVNTCNCVSTYLIAASGSLTGYIIFIYFQIYDMYCFCTNQSYYEMFESYIQSLQGS